MTARYANCLVIVSGPTGQIPMLPPVLGLDMSQRTTWCINLGTDA